MRSILGIIILSLGVYCSAQNANELRHVTTDSTYVDFYVQLDAEKTKYADTLYYAWFKSQAVHITQGFASGHLLNGPYTAYYISGQLFERGEFETGLRDGEWKTWYESGKIRSIENYDNGVLEGNFFHYNEAGTLVESGNYKAGKYHGEIIINGEASEYKNGKRQSKKNKPEEDINTNQPAENDAINPEEEPRKKWWKIRKKRAEEPSATEEKEPLLKRIFKSKKNESSDQEEHDEDRKKKERSRNSREKKQR